MSSQEESLNYLIGNFVNKTTTIETMNQTNMVSIDTSNGFLGFGTIDPSYHIHIDNSNGTIQTSKLIIKNIPRTPTGLQNNEVYCDASGNLKIKLPL